MTTLLDAPVVVSRAVRPGPAALVEVRRVVREVLLGWRSRDGRGPADQGEIAADLVDDVVLVASELVANAFRHGCGTLGDDEGLLEAWPLTPAAGPVAEIPVRLSLVRAGRHVVCSVSDPNPDLPEPAPLGQLASSGRGLTIVAALSQRWGWLPGRTDVRAGAQPGVEGKTVWAVFRVPLADAA